MSHESRHLLNDLLRCGQVGNFTVRARVVELDVRDEVAFLLLNDGSCHDNLRAVVGPGSSHIQTARLLTPGNAVELHGALVLSMTNRTDYEMDFRAYRLTRITPAEAEPDAHLRGRRQKTT